MIFRLFIILILAAAVFGGAYLAIHELYLKPKAELAADIQAERPAPPPDPSLRDFESCQETLKTGTPQEALVAFERFLKFHPTSSKRTDAENTIGDINIALFLNQRPGEANTYVVKTGDSLGRIARAVKMSPELIFHLNKMKSDVVHPGNRLVAYDVPFELVLKQRQQRVVVMLGGKFFRHYPALSWPGKAPAVLLPKQTARVGEKIATDAAGGAVKMLSPEFRTARHVIATGIAGYSIFSQPADPSTPVPRPPGGGIGLAPEHAAEIALLIPKSAPVTLD